MKITTFALYDWDGSLISEESFEYEGPIALCDRAQSKQVANQGMQQSAQNQENAQANLAATNNAVAAQQDATKRFMQFGRKTYGANGEFARTQNTIANTAAAAGSRATEGGLALHALRTGENTAGYATAAGENRRAASRDVTDQLARADSTRLDKLTAIQGIGLDASKFPAGVYSGLYGTSTGGAGSQLSSASNAAKTPGFWDEFAPALAGAAGSVATGFTPHG
jgi:hypothetical protein